jgi:membrane protein implicated in regulation of membrane protease activity
MNKLFSRTFLVLLILVGLPAAITMTNPSIIMVLIWTMIGLPLALLMAATPTLFLVLVMTRVLAIFVGGGIFVHFAALFTTLVLLAILPLVANVRIDAEMEALVSGDLNNVEMPLTGKVIAVRRENYSINRSHDQECDEFCIRALLNGAASEVIFQVIKDSNEPLNLDGDATSYRMERRTSCPNVNLINGLSNISVEGEERGFRSVAPQELMRLQIANGNCLISEAKSLRKAEFILSNLRIKRGKNDYYAGYDLFADTLTADRLTVHVRDGSSYKEVYRWTGVQGRKLLPILVPTMVANQPTQVRTGFLRKTVRKNINSGYYEKPNWSNFLTKTLGMKLDLDLTPKTESTRQVVMMMLQRDRGVPSSQNQILHDYFESFRRINEVPIEDQSIVKRIFLDERFPIDSLSWVAIKHAESAPQEYFDAVAIALFDRLRAVDPAIRNTAEFSWVEQTRSIAQAILHLPKETILKHRADLDWLAKQERLRVPAHRALDRLSEFGISSAWTYLQLIDDAQKFRDLDSDPLGDRHSFKDPYLAGVMGLCKLGHSARPIVAEIYQRLDSGALSKSDFVGWLTIALVNMGAPTDEIWSRLIGNEKFYSRDQFDSDVRQASRRDKCEY